MTNLINRSFMDKKPIEIIYLNNKGEITQRVIRVTNTSDDSIKAYCYKKKQVRTFKQLNILSVGKLNRKRTGA